MTVCISTGNCSSDECCVRTLDNPSGRICANRPGLGDVCSPALFVSFDYLNFFKNNSSSK